jgi:hypothetical protein
MRVLLLLFFSLTGFELFAAGDTLSDKPGSTPFDRYVPWNTCAVRGKVLPWLLGNDGGYNALLGFEFGFLRNQSLGVDGSYTISGGSHDDVTDTAGVHHDVGAHHAIRDKSLYLNYRYYFKARSEKDFYFAGAFLRYGRKDYYQDQLYQADFISKYEYHRSACFFLGWDHVLSPHLDLDLYLGAIYIQRDVYAVVKENNVVVDKVEHPQEVNAKFSINLSFWFRR